MARQLQRYLQHPDMLFRRVRDEHGNLQLSQRAAAFHPGQGVYRSSYKNARRLAATETNIAYRTADHERWQQLDFIVGIEVHLSNNHTCLGKDGKPHPFYDICDELKGKYPKDFKFTGWHPHCRCIATIILKTKEEMDADDEAILRGIEPADPDTSENAVTELPEKFRGWMETNQDRIARAKSLPYFIRDNEGLVKGVLSASATQEETTATQLTSRLDSLVTAKKTGLLPKSVSDTLMYIDQQISAKNFADAEMRISRLEAAVNRHNSRSIDDIEETNRRWQERSLVNLRQALKDGYLPTESERVFAYIEDSIFLGDYDDSRLRISRLQSAVKRHLLRTNDDIRRIQDAADERLYGAEYVKGVHEIEKILDVKRIKRMTHEEANTYRVNPNYLSGREYRINCSTCSGVYILRRMGFDVEALPKTKGSVVEKISKELETWKKWTDDSYTSLVDWMKKKGYTSMSKARYDEFYKGVLCKHWNI